ncbi:MAG: hypothetical protein KAJ40_06400, partial [Alphaproteobacteria bacterium]|nr:hypothetical protein [Alphaproteobacteria bacterium]
MTHTNIKAFYHNFFEKNLFERIIIYVCLSDLLVKIIFELGMGESGFHQSQHKQWFYFSFLALDYLLSFRKVANIRVTVNPTSLLAFVFFIMAAHGLFVGIMLHNAPFIIFNDLVPIVMIALNILRMQSFTEYKPVNTKSLLFICTCIVVTTSVIGLFAGSSIAGGTMYLPLLFAALFTLKPFPKWYALIGAAVIIMDIYDINRTTMAFAALVAIVYVVIHLFKNPHKAFIAFIVTIMTLVIAVNFVSEDTKTYRRVIGLTQVDLQES